MFGFCQVCQTSAELEHPGCCKSCSKTEKILTVVARQFMFRGRRPHVFDLAKAVGVDPGIVHYWTRHHIGDITRRPAKGDFSSIEDQVSGGTVRRVRAKWEHYWTDVSIIRRNPHRRIWLAS